MITFLLQMILASSLSYGSSTATPDPKADWPSPVMDSENFGLLLFDLLEYKSTDNVNSLDWDLVGWRGGDVHRLWVKSEGSSLAASPGTGEADFQLLYGRSVSAFFDAQIGARLEQVWGGGQSASRQSAVIGLQGLSLYRFEFEGALFVGEAGYMAARISASKDFLLSQRAITQLRFESNAAAKNSEKFATGSGLNDISLGLRFRYEFKREIAPYVGITWTNLYGETADYKKIAGGESTEVSSVGGLRLWF